MISCPYTFRTGGVNLQRICRQICSCKFTTYFPQCTKILVDAVSTYLLNIFTHMVGLANWNPWETLNEPYNSHKCVIIFLRSSKFNQNICPHACLSFFYGAGSSISLCPVQSWPGCHHRFCAVFWEGVGGRKSHARLLSSGPGGGPGGGPPRSGGRQRH